MNLERSEACPLCRAQSNHVLTDRLRRGSGTVFYCPSCEHGFLIPDQKIDAKSYYNEIYRKEYSPSACGGETNARELFDTYKGVQNGRLQIISPYLSPATHLLEIGASAGQFLVNIKDRVANVNAIELDEDCCDFMVNELGINADSDYFLDSKFAEEKYDIVCAFQVMEHVDSPVSFMRDIRTSMNDTSVAFIEVPNLHDPLLSVWDVKSYNSFYYHSAHLHYFTEKSLRKVALDAGFLPCNIVIEFSQDYNVLNHLNWIMNDAPQDTCGVGLNEICIQGKNKDISKWITSEIIKLNDAYVSRLIDAKSTSNLMMVIKNAP